MGFSDQIEIKQQCPDWSNLWQNLRGKERSDGGASKEGEGLGCEREGVRGKERSGRGASKEEEGLGCEREGVKGEERGDMRRQAMGEVGRVIRKK